MGYSSSFIFWCVRVNLLLCLQNDFDLAGNALGTPLLTQPGARVLFKTQRSFSVPLAKERTIGTDPIQVCVVKEKL